MMMMERDKEDDEDEIYIHHHHHVYVVSSVSSSPHYHAGYHLAKMPVDVRLGKMLIYACMLKVAARHTSSPSYIYIYIYISFIDLHLILADLSVDYQFQPYYCPLYPTTISISTTILPTIHLPMMTIYMIVSGAGIDHRCCPGRKVSSDHTVGPGQETGG